MGLPTQTHTHMRSYNRETCRQDTKTKKRDEAILFMNAPEQTDDEGKLQHKNYMLGAAEEQQHTRRDEFFRL